MAQGKNLNPSFLNFIDLYIATEYINTQSRLNTTTANDSNLMTNIVQQQQQQQAALQQNEIYSVSSVKNTIKSKNEQEKMHLSFNQPTNAFEMSFTDPYFGVSTFLIFHTLKL